MEDLKYFIRQSQGFRAGAGKAGKGMMRERERALCLSVRPDCCMLLSTAVSMQTPHCRRESTMSIVLFQCECNVRPGTVFNEFFFFTI